MQKKLLYGLGIGGVLSSVLSGAFIYFQSPFTFLKVLGFSASPIILFFLLVSIATFCFGSIIGKNMRRGALISLVVTAFLVMRYFGFRNFFHIILLTSIVVLFELAFFRTKSDQKPLEATPKT